MSHFSLSYPEGKAFDPVGRCIYCGDDANPEFLTREHIIPKGLNGTLVLPKASCPECAKVTSAVETFCLQRMFIDARTHLGLRSGGHRRNKQPRPPLRVEHVGADGETERWQELSTGEHPFALCTLDYAPAGFLCGRPPDVDPALECVIIPSPTFAEKVAKLPGKRALRYTVSTDMLARMIAKIAHCWAVANLGYGGFEGVLPDVILGKSPDRLFHYVGGSVTSGPGEGLHSLNMNKRDGLITANVRLFAYLNAPAYLVVVGRAA